MKIGIPKEAYKNERRVAGTPDTVKKLIKMGFEVVVQAGAGEGAQLADALYEQAGATVVPTCDELWESADIITKVRPPVGREGDDSCEFKHLKSGKLLISLLYPGQHEELVERLRETGASALALDKIPRISRAQKMDVLSSMSNITGYRAVIEAANHYPGFFSGQITAAGRTRPAQVLVIGAGVAGLASIAAARGLGAEVRAFDVRASVRDQIESLGARFLQVDIEESGEAAGGYAKTMSKEFIEAEMALFLQQAKEVDIIITTALIPGKRAPILVTKEMVQAMRPGSVVVDLAAEMGGNCAYTEPDRAIKIHGVTVIGYTDLSSRLATHASQFFGTNIAHLLTDMGGGTDFKIDFDDKVVRYSMVVHEGRTVWPPPPEPEKAVAAAPTPPAEAPQALPTKKVKKDSGALRNVMMLVAAVALAAMGMYAPTDFLQHFTVFVLAVFVGWQIIWAVAPALHTPLMSVTNAISGIIIVGGMLQAATGDYKAAEILGAVAILVASINIFGGFLVTQRMLAMFRKEG